MAVTRINPSSVYNQDEMLRIQNTLAQAIEDLQRQIDALKKTLGIS